MRGAAAVALVLAAGMTAGCGGDDAGEAETANPSSLPPTTLAFGASDVAEGQAIGLAFTCDGDNLSPALSWSGVPSGTAELALIVEDPDAPGGTFTHWLVYGLDPGTTELPMGVRPGGAGLLQGENDFGDDGYGGPCPPDGETHRYVFRLLALDEETGLEGGASRNELLAAVEGHVLGEAQLVGRYARVGG